MLQEGDPVPDVSLYGQDLDRMSPAALAAEGACLFVFYLFDWTGT